MTYPERAPSAAGGWLDPVQRGSTQGQETKHPGDCTTRPCTYARRQGIRNGGHLSRAGTGKEYARFNSSEVPQDLVTVRVAAQKIGGNVR